MAETRSRSIRIADDVWEAIQALPGKTDDALRALLFAPKANPNEEVNRWFRETWKRLEALPGETVEELLSASQSGGIPPGLVMLSEPRGLSEVMQEAGTYQDLGTQGRGIDPATIPGVSRGPVAKFDCRCVHSGCQGAKFQGASKFANLCPECVEAGHRDEPKKCPQCWEPA